MARESIEVAPPRPARTGIAPRRTKVVVRKVGPWSVLRWSLFFYFCIMLMFFFSLVIIYEILGSVGLLDAASKLAESVGLGCGASTAENPANCNFTFHAGWLFSRAFLFGVILVFVWSVVNMLISLLYNLVSDVIGGVEMTLIEKR